MDIGKWMTTGLLMAFAVLSGGELDEGGETSVWVGVKVDDEDYHTCAVYEQSKLMPKGMRCELPFTPVNGGYEVTTVSDTDTNSTQHMILYHCNAGYELVGEANRTCNGTSKQWTKHEPHCEPQYIDELRQRWAKLEVKVDDIDNKMTNKIADIDSSVTTITDRVAGIDNILNAMTALNDKWTSIVFLISQMDSVKEELSKAGELATVGRKDGSLVSQFQWTVKNIEEEITRGKTNRNYFIESQPFYTNVPGYRIKLRLSPNYRNTSHLGLFPTLVKGEFDNIVSWPFRDKYECVSDSRDGTQFGKMVVNPAKSDCRNTSFIQPPNNTGGCGEAEYIKSETLLSNKDRYLINGNLRINITVWLSN